MTPDAALAMSRYLVFAGVCLTLARVVIESWRQARRGMPWPRIAMRRLAYVPLVFILAYYLRALFFPGIPEPGRYDLAAINALYGVFFMLLAWPRRDRASDRFGRWR